MSFLPDPSVLASFIAATLLLNFTPGPDMTFFISRTLAQGRVSGFAALAGTTLGILVHTLLVAFGLSALIIASPTLFNALKFAGAAYLLWLAFVAIKNGSAFRIDTKKRGNSSLSKTVSQGLAINLLNPKIALFFMTFLPQFVSTGDPNTTARLLLLGFLFAITALCAMTPLVFIAESFADWMKENPRITRVIDYCFAGIFSAFALRLLFARVD